MLSISKRCLMALSDGPGTSEELAIEIGEKSKHVSTKMAELEARGLVVHSDFQPPAGKLCRLWQLAET